MSNSSEDGEVSSVSSADGSNNGDEAVALVVAPNHLSNNVPPAVNVDVVAEVGGVLPAAAPPTPGHNVAM